jgi:hypothetical protein
MARNLAVAGGILGVLLVAMATALYLYLRGFEGSTPVASPIAVGGATATSPPGPTAAPTATTRPTSLPIAAPTAAPTIEASPEPEPWWERTNQFSEALGKEIGEAYLHYWEVVEQAYLEVDSGRLPEVEDGAELARDLKAIDDFRNRGQAQKLVIEHEASVTYATANEAVVYDEYLSRSYFVDPETKEGDPTSSGPAIQQKVAYLLTKSDHGWKVVDGVRFE